MDSPKRETGRGRSAKCRHSQSRLLGIGPPPVRLKLDPFVGVIDRILKEDKLRPSGQHILISVRKFRRATGNRFDSFRRRYCQSGDCGSNQTRRAQFE
jgi:hypothetical protein